MRQMFEYFRNAAYFDARSIEKGKSTCRIDTVVFTPDYQPAEQFLSSERGHYRYLIDA